MIEKLLTWLTTYCLIILCEMGDKTQVAVLLFASNNPARRWLIYGASALALTLCVILEVTVGVTLRRYVGPAVFNRVTGIIFIVLGIAALIESTGVAGRPGPAKTKARVEAFDR